MRITFLDNKRQIAILFGQGPMAHRFFMPWPYRFCRAVKFWLSHDLSWSEVII